MLKISRFEIHGPRSSLKSMAGAMLDQTPHLHYFTRETGADTKVWVLLYEDLNTAVHCSRCVTCILSEEPSHLLLEIADVGKQSGFRGSQGLDDQPVFDHILDFILDYSKQFGLTVQKKDQDIKDS